MASSLRNVRFLTSKLARPGACASVTFSQQGVARFSTARLAVTPSSSSPLWKFGFGVSVATAAVVAGFSLDPPKAAQCASSKATPKPLFSKEDTTVIFVLGGPGAGKGTQCAKLVNDFGFVHLSAGDLLRAERERPGSEFGELINNYIKEGKIVPMEITISLLKNAMLESKTKRFLIDGFPRALDQGLAFETQVCECSFVLFFECPELEMERRLLKRGETSGRVDDNIESIRKRFKTFVETSLPVVDYYGKQGKVRTLSCLRPIDDVYSEVRTTVAKELKKL